MKMKAKAPANIAFIKYWGKRNELLNLTLDSVKINGEIPKDDERQRVVKHLDLIRKLSKIKLFTEVISENNFPKGTGIASSASGFAALTLAACSSAGLKLSERDLSVLARLGSGSACRSIPDGFVEWKAGRFSNTSYAYSLYPDDFWD